MDTLLDLVQRWRVVVPTIDTAFGCEREIAAATERARVRCADDLQAACTLLRDQLTQIEQEMRAASKYITVPPKYPIQPLSPEDVLSWADRVRDLAASLPPKGDHARMP